jgi:two-component system LytT family response regulator
VYKVLIIDDEPLARALVRNLLERHPQLEVAGECGDGFEGIKMIGAVQPHLVFLDVQMPRLTGFEMLELIDSPPDIIFTTAFDEYAVKAFEAHAADYLLKPLQPERFHTAVERWTQHRTSGSAALSPAGPESAGNMAAAAQPDGYTHRIVVKDNSIIRIIPLSDIQYLEGADDYVKIHTADGVFLKKTTLAQLEASLDPRTFVRSHRSVIVPVSQILRIDRYEKDGHTARLHCGATVSVSKAGLTRLKEVLSW